MPELPEVETIKRDLAKKVVDKKIVGIKINKPKIIKEPGTEAFKNGLIGKTIKEVKRRAKLLILRLDEEKFLIVHLRISGWLLYGQRQDRARIVFELSDGKYLNYMDQRVLGEMRLRSSYEDLKFVKELGPEPFEITLSEFEKLVRKRKTKIKVLLLDQKIISGIGNIYAQEALFLAKIDPRKLANELTDKESKLLYEKVVSVLKEGIKHKGSSVDSYRNLSGDKGGMEKRLKVYGRAKKPCCRCKTLIQKIALGGRGTCFCPKCQQ